MKTFHLGAILSVATGIMLAAKFADVHELLDHMTGDTLFTHQLPRACGECAPELLRQLPDLAGIEVPQFASPQDYMDWLDMQVIRYGAFHEVQPLKSADHTVIDPLAELAMVAPHMTVIPVAINRKES